MIPAKILACGTSGTVFFMPLRMSSSTCWTMEVTWHSHLNLTNKNLRICDTEF